MGLVLAFSELFYSEVPIGVEPVWVAGNEVEGSGAVGVGKLA